MPTASFCANCASVQPLLRAYWWDMLEAFFGTCSGCRSDILVRPASPEVQAAVDRIPAAAFALVPV